MAAPSLWSRVLGDGAAAWLWSLPSVATTGCSTSRRSGPEVTPGMYAVDRSSLPGSQLAATFVPSQRDGTTDHFLAAAARDGCNASRLAAARRDRTRFLEAQRLRGWSRTDASAAFLNMTLLVASPEQLRRVLARADEELESGRREGGAASASVEAAAPNTTLTNAAPTTLTLLDIGAGRGEATAALASALGVRDQDVTVMESAAQIRSRLAAERGYRAVSSFDELGAGQTFGAVAMLNVLDRCDDPRGLLRSAVSALRPGGLLLIATVLPFCPLVYQGAVGKVGAHRPPTRPLRLPHGLRCGAAKDTGHLGRGTFARHLSGFVSAMVGALPLRLQAWTRVPYLCSGTTEATYYHLDNALLVLRRTQAAVPASVHGAAPAAARRLDLGAAEGVQQAPAGHGGSTISANTAPPARLPLYGGHDGALPLPALCKASAAQEWSAFTWLGEQVTKATGSWGDVLDAGLGKGSLCWLLRQPLRSLTGVTAQRDNSAYGHGPLQRAVRHIPKVRLLLGNWRNASLVGEARYDVVVLDYLLAAVNMHWAYNEEAVLERVLRSVRPRVGMALLTGIEPYELTLERRHKGDAAILDAESLGDAAALLAGRRSYRELPLQWVLQQVRSLGLGFTVVATRDFGVTFTHASLRGQLDFARSEAQHVDDPELRRALEARASRLLVQIKQLSKQDLHRRARSYAVVLRRD